MRPTRRRYPSETVPAPHNFDGGISTAMGKKIIFIIGLLTILWIVSTQLELRDPNTPRIIDPSRLQVPQVDVRR